MADAGAPAASPDAGTTKTTCPAASGSKICCTITSKTVATSPGKRTRTTIGVGEAVDLTAKASSDVTWAVASGGTLSTTTGTTTRLTAGDTAATATVTATGSDGASATLSFTVVEPSGVVMVQYPNSHIAHLTGVPTIGIRLQAYIAPDTVSFVNVQVSEGDCVSVANGYMSSLNGVHHAGHGAGVQVTLTAKVVAGKGTALPSYDTAQGSAKFGTPYADGTFTWNIPWSFQVGSGTPKQFATVTQQFVINPAGGMWVGKGGVSGSNNLDDPSQNY